MMTFLERETCFKEFIDVIYFTNKLPAYTLTYTGFCGKILGAAQFTQLCNPGIVDMSNGLFFQQNEA